jgi:transcriptional regulator with XRE-family HTH domain
VKEYAMTAQELLRVIREAHKLTQVQVSARTGIPQPTVSKIERGDVEDVRASTYLALKALHDELQAPAWDGTERRKNARTQ